MRLHRDAKTTPQMRQLIVDWARRQGWTQRAAADAAGISVRTVAKWIARVRAGDPALPDRSSRPHRMPRQFALETTAAILVHRQEPATAWQISAAARVPRSTVARVLRRAGLNRLKLLEPTPVIQRYEWPYAGHLLHPHIKPLGRIRGIGHRITGDRHRRQPGVGYEYAHVAVDDAMRVAYVEVRRSQRRRACVAFFRLAAVWYRRRGIPVRWALTDNGNGYRSELFARACRSWRVRHKFTRPYTPRTNGQAERLIQTLLREWAYRRPYQTSAQRTAALTPYLRFYNHQRPHASLGRRSPWTRFLEAA